MPSRTHLAIVEELTESFLEDHELDMVEWERQDFARVLVAVMEASLTAEERRFARFDVYFEPPEATEEGAADDPGRVMLEDPPEVSAHNLARLAPAVGYHGAAIHLRAADGRTRISGWGRVAEDALHLAVEPTEGEENPVLVPARSGGYWLKLCARGPGLLLLKEGFSEGASGPRSHVRIKGLSEPEVRLSYDHDVAPPHLEDPHNLQALLPAVLGRVQAARTGATFAFLPVPALERRDLVDVRFPVTGVDFVRLVRRAYGLEEDEEGRPTTEDDPFPVRDAVERIAALAATDGCVVIDPLFVIRGFGGKIRALPPPPDRIPAHGRGGEPLPIADLGMRHRSAAALAQAAPGAVVYVVSEDGPVTVLVGEEGGGVTHCGRYEDVPAVDVLL